MTQQEERISSRPGPFWVTTSVSDGRFERVHAQVCLADWHRNSSAPGGRHTLRLVSFDLYRPQEGSYGIVDALESITHRVLGRSKRHCPVPHHNLWADLPTVAKLVRPCKRSQVPETVRLARGWFWCVSTRLFFFPPSGLEDHRYRRMPLYCIVSCRHQNDIERKVSG